MQLYFGVESKTITLLYWRKYFIIFYCRKNKEEMRDEKRTLDCLKKGARIASQCLDPGVQVQLYVELLNHYLFYFERGNSLITVAMLNQVIINKILVA